MSRHFCVCFSLKTGAFIMCFFTLVLGVSEIIIGLIGLSDPEDGKLINDELCNRTKACDFTFSPTIYPKGEPGYEGNVTLFIACSVLGVVSVLSGILLLIGIIQAKERFVLWYVLLGSVALFVVTIYAGMNMFYHKVLFLIFIMSIFMCVSQVSMYNFYEEIAEYNTVNSGVIEITYNGDAKSYANSMMIADDSFDNTAL